MSLDTFMLIIDKLKSIEFTGRLSYNLYNEPLLRKDLEVFVDYARKALPRSFQLIYTNGDFLDDNRYETLLRAGVDRFVVTRHGWDPIPEREFQVVQYPSDLDISGRGGVVLNIKEPLNIPCFAPTEMLIVTVNGDVILCHEDAYRSQVMGNLTRQSLEEVWFSERFIELRKLLSQGQRGCAASVCSKCSHRNYPLPATTI